MLAKHTGAFIAKTLMECLGRVEVLVDNVYSSSTDKGSKMLRAAEVIKLYQSHLLDDFLINSGLTFHEQEEAYNIFIDKELKKHAIELQKNKYAFSIH